MNTRQLGQLINSSKRISRLSKVITRIESNLEPISEKSDSLFRELDTAAKLCRHYVDFFNATILYANSFLPIINKYEKDFKACEDKLNKISEKIKNEKLRREKAKYIGKASGDEAIIAKLDAIANTLNKQYSHDFSYLKNNLVVEPLIDFVAEKFYSDQSPQVHTYAQFLNNLSAVKTKRAIEAFILQFGIWAKAHLNDLAQIKAYEKFIFVIKEFGLNNKALVTELSKQDVSFRQFFSFINQLKSTATIKEETHKDIPQIDELLIVVEKLSNLEELKEKLLANKENNHARTIESVENWLKKGPTEKIKEKLVSYILEIEELLLEFSEHEETLALQVELKKQFRTRYPTLELPQYEESEEAKSKVEERVPASDVERRRLLRIDVRDRLIDNIKTWLKKTPELEQKMNCSHLIRDLEYALIDSPDDPNLIELLAKMNNSYQHLYQSEKQLPVIKNLVDKSHVRLRSNTVTEPALTASSAENHTRNRSNSTGKQVLSVTSVPMIDLSPIPHQPADTTSASTSRPTSMHQRRMALAESRGVSVAYLEGLFKVPKERKQADDAVKRLSEQKTGNESTKKKYH